MVLLGDDFEGVELLSSVDSVLLLHDGLVLTVVGAIHGDPDPVVVGVVLCSLEASTTGPNGW